MRNQSYGLIFPREATGPPESAFVQLALRSEEIHV